jgi:hypothetical protein
MEVEGTMLDAASFERIGDAPPAPLPLRAPSSTANRP